MGMDYLLQCSPLLGTGITQHRAGQRRAGADGFNVARSSERESPDRLHAPTESPTNCFNVARSSERESHPELNRAVQSGVVLQCSPLLGTGITPDGKADDKPIEALQCSPLLGTGITWMS